MGGTTDGRDGAPVAAGGDDLEAAAARLRAFDGGFDWLLSGKQAWSVAEVVAHLEALLGAGQGPSHDTVTRWFKQMPDTMDFGGLGLRASRAGLVRFLAGRFVNDNDGGQRKRESA